VRLSLLDGAGTACAWQAAVNLCVTRDDRLLNSRVTVGIKNIGISDSQRERC